MSNMVIGFIAIIVASKGTKEGIALAGTLVFVASFFDLFDGAAARALNVESEIGGQLDSLADAVSYGIAPGIIAYQAYFQSFPQIGFGINAGMLFAAVFPLCATYRLARFNVEDDNKKGFTGLPSPAAGIMVAAIPALEISKIPFFGIIHDFVPLWLYIIIFLGSAFLMITQVDYNKLFNDLFKKGKTIAIIIILLMAAFLVVFKMWAVFIVISLYIVLGLIIYCLKSIAHDVNKEQ